MYYISSTFPKHHGGTPESTLVYMDKPHGICLYTQSADAIAESDFVIKAQRGLLQGEVAKVKVDVFPSGHTDIPLAGSSVTVTLWMIHRFQHAFRSNQILQSTTTRTLRKRERVLNSTLKSLTDSK